MDEIFRTDDFFALQKKYFSDNKTYLNPATTRDDGINDLNFNELFRSKLREVTSYHNDSTQSGIEAKKNIINLVNAIDEIKVDLENITLTPSITSSSFITLKALSDLGVKRIWMETPCYYATLFQAKSLGMEIKLIPSYLQNNFQWELPSVGKNDAVWITQPRISISMNQDDEHLKKLIDNASNNYYLVVDEATELGLPSKLSKLSIENNEFVIRLKGVYKPLGINGPRVAYIIHGGKTGSVIKKWVWTFHGGIDAMSIRSIPACIREINDYKMLIGQTKEKASKAFRLIETHLLGKGFKIIGYENGYTTCLVTKLIDEKSNNSFDLARIKLITRLKNQGIQPVLGPSMYFAHDGTHEYVRFNLLTDLNAFITAFK
jgi:histidinol-phosphate/aromatic aminotransferase/cobyric acid decarboxylase-like protein